MKKLNLVLIVISFTVLLPVNPGLQPVITSTVAVDDPFWTVTFYGDTRNGHEVHRQLLDMMQQEENIKFLVHVGDLVMYGGSADYWDEYQEIVANVTLPIYTAIGNHERYTGFGTCNDNYTYYYEVTQAPGPWYSWDYGYIHFIILSTEHYFDDGADNFTIAPEQLNWLINDLNTTGKSFIIVSLHRPLYGLRTERINQTESVRAALEPVFQQYGVDVVFQGHVHTFCAAERGGINYFVTGGGGAPLHDIPHPGDLPDYQPDSDTAIQAYQYTRMRVRPDNITIDAVLLDGSIPYSLVLDTGGDVLSEWKTSAPEMEVTGFTWLVIPLFVAVIPVVKRRREKRHY
ncbi:MAG: metallophosphoesterase family protein [Candidatus Odinarchaeota archaeon]